jgi:hypothetical protein
MNHMIDQLNDKSIPLSERIEIATTLWEATHDIQSALNEFKGELISLAGNKPYVQLKGEHSSIVRVCLQPPSPNLEGVSTEQLKSALGSDYETYIAESKTLRWSAYKEAPSSVWEDFEKVCPIQKRPRYQVKFSRS